VTTIAYYSHRYGVNPHEFDASEERIRRYQTRNPGVFVIATWITFARGGCDEARVWEEIEAAIACCNHFVLDLDGQPEPSPGQKREREIAEAAGITVEVLP
jgi:hypothetical protein